ncbi:S-adenosyl-L-methionine-dependent methyltransferase [Endogone sp. FLAS-F59071]|nr:S-adenosyl-L-methionine-dependent methyltransferase [Endogone sp. FLAS-F59071]|eukprot:RUS15409.1 S-adenosyl-L-methionine-dependent methyltransferase [Endogone sp. FLAS-F59071]
MNGFSSIWKSSGDSEAMQSAGKPAKDYKWIGERRYHEANPKYLFPSDDAEVNRQRKDHFITRNFLAPIRNPLEANIRVLDVGCGAGTWTIEMAKEFPESNFLGMDIAQYHPTSFLPRNVMFKQANTLTGLPCLDNSIDYVFQRAAAFCFTDKEWAKVINELARVTKPGGWIELVEYEYVFPNPCTRLAEYLNKLKMALGVRGIHTEFFPTHMPEILQGPEFRNITYNSFKTPLGGSTKLGKESLKSFELALTSMSPRMCAVMGVRSEELDNMIVEMLKEYVESEATMKIHVVYGMKPMIVKIPGSSTKSA